MRPGYFPLPIVEGGLCWDATGELCHMENFPGIAQLTEALAFDECSNGGNRWPTYEATIKLRLHDSHSTTHCQYRIRPDVRSLLAAVKKG